jgi:hypothetical protein
MDVRRPGLEGAQCQREPDESQSGGGAEERSPAISHDGENDVGGMDRD